MGKVARAVGVERERMESEAAVRAQRIFCSASWRGARASAVDEVSGWGTMVLEEASGWGTIGFWVGWRLTTWCRDVGVARLW